MYAMIHSAEITHRQRAAEFARAAEYARRRAELPPAQAPAPARRGLLRWHRPPRIASAR